MNDAAPPPPPPSTRKRVLGWGLLAGLVAAGVYLVAWPVPIEPLPWTPSPAPALEGPYAPNRLLAAVERLDTGGVGPEDVAVGADGAIYGGLLDGRIVRLAADGSGLTTLVDTGGRPLGLDLDAQGRLLVADADRGLLRVDVTSGALEVLATEHGGRPFRFTDDVDVAADGTVYFSDASDRFGVHDYRLDLLEHRPNGRLLAYGPEPGRVRCVLDKVHFANGVAVSPDQSFVLVVETGRYRVLRHWLSGPKRGESDLFVDNLPGFPDGISAGPSGLFWLALASPRDPMVDRMLPTPSVRKVLVRLPQALLPAPKRHAFLLGLDRDGHVVHCLQDDAPASYSPVTSAEEVGDALYLGSLLRSSIARLPWPAEGSGR